MKLKKLILATVITSLVASFGFAREITVQAVDGDFTIELNNVPEELLDLIEENKSEIEMALKENDIKVADLEEAKKEGVFKEVDDIFKDMQSSGDGTDNGPNIGEMLSSVKEGINGITNSLAGSIANAQLLQNVWAEAWVGQFFPFKPDGVHIGGGVNAGVSQLKLKPIFDVVKAVGGDLDGLPSNFIFPTITADFRIGGIMVPFDVGFSILKFDISAFIPPEDFTFDYLTFGIDARYAVLTGEGWLPKVSVGAGIAYTSGKVGVPDSDFGVNAGFNTFNFYLQSQISKKLAFFIPFAGFKLAFANTKLYLDVSLNWDEILGNTGDDDFNDIFIGDSNASLKDLNFLPSHIGQEKNQFKCVPQLFGGFGLDLFVVNLTFFGGIDIVNGLWSAGFNFRIAW